MIDKKLRPEPSTDQASAEEHKGKPIGRFILVGAVLAGFAIVTIFQLFRWQVVEHSHLVSVAQDQTTNLHKNRVLPRGRIMDHGGHLLAVDIFEYSLWASPEQVAASGKLENSAEQLAPLLGQTAAQIVNTIKNGGVYVLIAKHIPEQIGERIDSLVNPREGTSKVPGFDLEVSPKRMYPEGPLAAHVLGFVNISQDPYYGLEEYYGRQLVGEVRTVPASVKDDPILALCNPPEVKPGRELILTIDRAVQYMVEKELAAALQEYQAPSGTIIVMDPRTGAVLAMASQPKFDPNHYMTTPQDRFANPAISKQYEPGSVFKILTMAAGIDAGAITPRTTFNDTGEMEVGGRPIYNWDRAGHGQVNMVDVLAQSLNVGAAFVSVTLARDRFYTYMRRFGFGRLTDVDLAGEAVGSLKLPGDSEWHESDLGTNSFGQGIAVTPLQMIRAAACVANRGLLMKPYVVAQIIDGDQVVDVRPTVVRRAISADTAEQVTNMMIEAVERETSLALVSGYTIAGKTGTAEIPTPGGYTSQETIASFIGFAPARDPRFIVLVKIDKPKASPWGSKVAAPVFRKIAEQLFSYLDIVPDNVSLVSR